jgi:hypothetical protein
LANRKGFFRRLGDLVHRLVIGPPEVKEPRPPPETPRPPPEQPGPDSPPGGYLEWRLQQEYHAITGTGYEYPDWYDLFTSLQIEFDDDAEHEYFWELFLRSFYLASDDPGSVRRGDSNDPGRFYRESGIPPSAVDWSLWRDLHKTTNPR